MERSTVINLQSPTVATEAYGSVILEQADWADHRNTFTALDVVSTISDAFYGSEDSSFSDCEVVDNRFDSVIYAYPDPHDLIFDLAVTYGSLGGYRAYTHHTIVEMLSFKLGDTAKLKYPLYRIIKTEWVTDCYSAEGNVMPAPGVSREGGEITLSTPTYGSLLISYETVRYYWSLNIGAREDVNQNFYQSVAYAYWAGGVSMLEIEPPDNAEEDRALEVNCGNRGILHVKPDDDDPDKPRDPPVPYETNRTIYVEYCSQGQLMTPAWYKLFG